MKHEPEASQVKRFFDDTQVYLKNSVGISIRALLVRSLLGELNNVNIVDLGCGDGSISLQYLSKTNSITLVDLSANMLHAAMENLNDELPGNVELINQDFLGLSWKSKFDIVLCLGVLAHVQQLETAMAQVAAFVKPGGRCIVQFTDNDRIIAKVERFYRSQYLWRRTYGYITPKINTSLVKLMGTKNGLRPLEQRRFSFLLPGMGKLPNKWLYKYQLWTLTSRLISRHASEVILLFEKQ